MVNKCSVTGCKSLYVKDNVKLHRFPLTNEATLPLWIAATKREKEWRPCKSSRLCGNHFQESEYIVGHGKGVLKPTAIPTIDYREETPRYIKKKSLNICENMGHLNKLMKVEPMDNDTHVEIVQLNLNDFYEHQNKIKTNNSYDNNEVLPFYKNEYAEEQNNEDIMEDNKGQIVKIEADHVDDTSNDGPIKNEYEYDNEICNRENQCYMFTSSFKEGAEPIVFTPTEDKLFEEPSNMNIEQSTANNSFNKVMALKLKRERRTKDIYSLYFKSLNKKISHKQEGKGYSYYDDTASFGAFIEAQMKELRPHKKIYLTTKHRIQKILMKAQLKIAN